MSILGNKYSSGTGSAFNKETKFKSFLLGKVDYVGTIPVDNTLDNSSRKRNERYNSDKHCIKVRVVGAMYDKDKPVSELPNCFPLLPKHLNFIPKKDEVVLVLITEEDDINADRYYVGPFISNETKLNGDYANTTATSNKLDGTLSPLEEIDRVVTAKGVYENPEHVTIDGRENTDIIQRSGEVLIRAGKFVKEDVKLFNSQNPGVFQIKYNQNFNEREINEYGVGVTDSVSKIETKNVTVTNIMSDKINFLTHSGDKEYDITSVVKESNGAAQYISNDEMDNILNYAHPLVFGDKLVEYLKLLKEAFLTHRHQINEVPSQPEGYPIKEFVKKANQLEKEMLSKNIRIN